MTREETRQHLVAAKTSIGDAIMYLSAVKRDHVAMANLTGHGSIDTVMLELQDQYEYLMEAFSIGPMENCYL